MRNWGIVLAVIAALLLAILLVGSPDTGGEVAPRRGPPLAEVEAPRSAGEAPVRARPAPQAEPDAEEPAPEEEEEGRVFREDGGPLPAASTEAGLMATRVHPMWSDLVQQLSDQANFHPDATQLESQSVMILREIDRVVRDEGGDPAELERMQRQAIDALRQSDLQDEAMQRDLDAIERELERWHQQTEGIPPEP